MVHPPRHRADFNPRPNLAQRPLRSTIRILNSHLPSSYSVSTPEDPLIAPIQLPTSALDWAFAGVATSTPIPSSPPTKTEKHCTWSHEIDSRTPLAGVPLADEGTVAPDPEDDECEVETGRMVNPDSGVEEAYEERWRALPVERCGLGGQACLVLRLNGDEGVEAGLWVMAGKWAQGVWRRRLRGGDGEETFWATRWQWGEKVGWRCEVLVGPDGDGEGRTPPNLFTKMLEPWKGQPGPVVGASVHFEGREDWICVESV